jgi:hypothetical protein
VAPLTHQLAADFDQIPAANGASRTERAKFRSRIRNSPAICGAADPKILMLAHG